MAQDLVLQGGKFALPAHLAEQFAGQPSNLKVMSSRVPTLSLQGRAFTITADGKSKTLTREVEGETFNVMSLPVIILGFQPERGRSYYSKPFDPKNIVPPDCWSRDGKTPDPEVKEKQSPTCATCPMAVKGSRVSDSNKAVAACQEFRLLCVIPYAALHGDMPPLRLRLPPTSDYDGLNTEAKKQDKYAFSQYVDFIRSRGVPQSYAVITRMSFDQTQGVNFPKVWFEAKDWVLEKDAVRIKELLASPDVEEALSISEAAVAEQHANAQRDAGSTAQGAVTHSARGGTTHHTTKPAETKAAEPAGPTPEEIAATEAAARAEQERLAAAQAKAAKVQAAKEAAARAAAEAARLAAEAEAEANGDGAGDAPLSGEVLPPSGGAGIAMNLGDDDETSTGKAQAAEVKAAATVDAKDPPQPAHVEDKDVDDIMKQWSGD